MKNKIKSIREENSVSGCVISVLWIKCADVEKYPKIKEFFCKLCDKYAEFVKSKCFAKDKEEFEKYVSEGGRRSKFPKREYFFTITELRSGKEGFATFKRESIFSVSGIVRDYSLDCKTWRTSGETLCLFNDISPKRPKLRFDGFYLANGEAVFYKTSPIWRERECSLRETAIFEKRVPVKEIKKRKEK